MASSIPAKFPFPPIYSFPPFFTRQVNERTWHSQLMNWKELILAYCRFHRIFVLDLSQVGGSRGLQTDEEEEELQDETTEIGELFSNKTIGRALKQETVQSIFEYMVSTGAAGWLDEPESAKKKRKTKQTEDEDEENGYEQQYAQYEALKESGGGSSNKNRSAIVVYWRRPSEWATLVSDWVDATGQGGSVLTLYELVESDAVNSQEFRGLHPAILKEVVDVLVSRQKAAVMRDSTGLVAGIKVM